MIRTWWVFDNIFQLWILFVFHTILFLSLETLFLIYNACCFGFTIESLIKKMVNLTRCQNLKMCNFCSTPMIYLKFSPDNIHHKVFWCMHFGFKELRPAWNPKLWFPIYRCVALTKIKQCTNFYEYWMIWTLKKRFFSFFAPCFYQFSFFNIR